MGKDVDSLSTIKYGQILERIIAKSILRPEKPHLYEVKTFLLYIDSAILRGGENFQFCFSLFFFLNEVNICLKWYRPCKLVPSGESDCQLFASPLLLFLFE